MSRPETISEVSDRYINFASFDLNLILGNPKLLKAYTALIEQVQAAHGKVAETYGSHVEVRLLRTEKQLQDQLRTDQYTWDDKQKAYAKMLAGEDVPDYRHNSIREWAKENGLPDPKPETNEVAVD